MQVTQEIDKSLGAVPPHAPVQRLPLVRLKDLAWLVYLYPLRWVMCVLPVSVAFLLGDALAAVAPWFLGTHRKRLTAKLVKAFPNDAAMVRRICSQYFRKAIVRFFDDLLVARMMRNGGLKNVKLVHLENLTDTLSAGHGAVLMTGHFFAGRVAKRYLTSIGFPSMTLRQPDPVSRWAGLLGRNFLQRRYTKLLGDVIGEEISTTDPECSLKMLARLRTAGMVTIHADVALSQQVSVRQFLGRERKHSIGYLQLAWVAGAPVVPIHCRGSARGLVIEFDPPLDPTKWADRESFVRDATDWMWERLENHVRRTPEQWDLWMRW